MPERTPFLLRLDPEVMAALRKWAADDLRSLNGQIEFLLRRSLREAGRIGGPEGSREADPAADADMGGVDAARRPGAGG